MKGNLTMPARDQRYDLSSCLIYEFRDIDGHRSDAAPLPYRWHDRSISEENLIPARFLMRHAINEGQLWATWSIQDGVPRIYGPRPAVCFTEMSVPEFVEGSRRRTAEGGNLGSYALVLPKSVVWDVGGRPVINGLSGDARTYTDSRGGTLRLAKSTLPSSEQYRYVPFDPTTGSRDFQHGREWRCPLKCELGKYIEGPRDAYDPPYCFSFMPSGMPIDEASMRGIGVIVATRLEAERVTHDILSKVDRGDVARDHYAFVLAHQAIPDWENLRDRETIEAAIFDNMITLDQYFVDDPNAEVLVAELDALVLAAETTTLKEKKNIERPCYLWLADSRHPLVRALVNKGRIKFTRSGRYLVEFPTIKPRRARHHTEAMINEIASTISERYGISASSYADDNRATVRRHDCKFFNGASSDVSFAFNRDWDSADTLFKTDFEMPSSKFDATGNEHVAEDIPF